jgi:hypothetical protein
MHEKDPAKRLSAEDALKELKKLSDREFVNYLAAGTPKRPAKVAPVKVSTQQVRKSAPKPRLAISRDRVEVIEGSASIDPAKLKISGDSVLVEPSSLPGEETVKPSRSAEFIRKYWKELLIAWVFTPFGWIIYRLARDRKLPTGLFKSAQTKSLRVWEISFIVLHAFSFGLLAPIVGIPLALKLRDKATTVFIAINTIFVVVGFNAIFTTPDGGTLPTIPGLIFLFNYLAGFFLPLAIRLGRLQNAVLASETQDKEAVAPSSDEDRIDPFDDEDYFANAQAKLKKEPKKSWNDLRDAVTEILSHSGIERFSIEFAQSDISGIYFQGFLEKSGCITIEAAGNLSVRPEITSEQNRNIIRAGWEPPAGENPNYIKFLDLTQSNLEFISELIISTLRDGYGAAIDGLEPVFSVNMGGEIIYVDFAEFKRLTSQ